MVKGRLSLCGWCSKAVLQVELRGEELLFGFERDCSWSFSVFFHPLCLFWLYELVAYFAENGRRERDKEKIGSRGPYSC